MGERGWSFIKKAETIVLLPNIFIWFAILYQSGFAYAVALMINQFGGMFTGDINAIGLTFAFALLAGMIYMMVRPYEESVKPTKKMKRTKSLEGAV